MHPWYLLQFFGCYTGRSVVAFYDAAILRRKGALGPASHLMLVDISDRHNKIIVMLSLYVAANLGEYASCIFSASPCRGLRDWPRQHVMTSRLVISTPGKIPWPIARQ
jgi:hypothetical protein